MTELIDERIEALEQERAELVKRTNQAIATAQDRTYWLDRWQLDLNQTMARPSGYLLKALVRSLRMPKRLVRKLRHRS